MKNASEGYYAKIIKDSINPAGHRITTMECRYWRAIHSELMTHRDFSRNAASSRAIPIWKMIRAVITDPAGPLQWGTKKAGMQAGAELEGFPRAVAIWFWYQARWAAVLFAWLLDRIGIHKQIANRFLEPWSWITVVVTSTKWANFFALRAHPMAQPEFQFLAYLAAEAYATNAPDQIAWGEWHLPYTDYDDYLELCGRMGPKIADDEMIGFRLAGRSAVYHDGESVDLQPQMAKISAARCARVSFLNQNGIRAILDDFGLHDRLTAGDPLHASALEHPAQAIENKHIDDGMGDTSYVWEDEKPSNFHPSWRQFRKTHPRENIVKVDLLTIINAKPDWIKNLGRKPIMTVWRSSKHPAKPQPKG